MQLNNDGSEPVLATPGETWASFASQWVQQCLDDESVAAPRLILSAGARAEDLVSLDRLAASLPKGDCAKTAATRYVGTQRVGRG